MSITTVSRATLEDFLTLPVGPPHHEFENGEIIALPSPTIDHQEIVDAIVAALRRHVLKNSMGRVFREVDVYLPDGRVYVPDIGFVAQSRLDIISPVDRKVHGAPDLVVEVTSTDEARDRGHKFHVYYENGVQWYWIIDGDSLFVEEYQTTPQGYVRTSSVAASEMFAPGLFPGLSFDMLSLVSAQT